MLGQGREGFILALGLALLAGLATDGLVRFIAIPAAALLGAALASLRVRASRAEEALAHVREDYRQLIDLPAQATWICDPQGRFLFISARWMEWTGFDFQSTKKEWTSLIHPDDRSRLVAKWAKALESGAPHDQEHRVRFRSGQYRWMRARAFAQRDPAGAIVRWVGQLEDIHERKISEEQLRQTSSLLQMIGRSTDSIIYAKDRDGRMLYANRALEQMSGLSLEDIIGKKDSEWNPNQEEAEAFVAVDRMVLAGGSTLDLEEVSTGRDGIQRTYRSLKSPLRSRSGEVIGVVGIATDISEQREAEQRERLLMRELDHRAKNMLAVVQSVVALTRAPTVPAFKEAIDGRIRALGRAHSMLSGSCWEGADLQRIVEEELAPFQDRAARSQVAGPPVFLKPAAAQSLALVLHELATNAAKYGALATPTGFLDIRWELAPSAAGSMDLRLRWTERGGREVSPRPEQSRSGFGTRLVRSSIERQLGGSLTMDWASEGLTLSLAVPLEPGEPRQSGELASGSKGPVPIPLPAHAVRRRTRRQLA